MVDVRRAEAGTGWKPALPAAAILGIDQPKVSALLNGRLSGFSMDRLVRFLLALDRDVQITVRPKQDDRAHVTVA